MKLFKSLTQGLLFLFACNFSYGQAMELEGIVQKFDLYRTQRLQEKLYVHVDRSFFLTGEIMWFKIYSIDGVFHSPLDLSKVAYVELLDRTNASVRQAKIELRDGSGSGSLFIPATLASGNYLLRTYTNWMQNMSPEFYFQKVITIVNPFEKTDQEPEPKIGLNSLEFFPEGGNLISGIGSKVAFKATNSSGKGIACTGSLLSDSGDTTLTFRPDRFGIGTFTFTPLPHVTYTAVMRDSLGTVSTHSFPRAYDHGFVMHVESIDKEKLSIQITSKPAQNHIPLVYLFIHTRQKIVKAEAQFLKNNTARFTIPKEELGDGISHITIFDSDLRPVCERLYFKQPTKKLDIRIATQQQEYELRKKVALTIRVDTTQKTKSNLSISVYKIDSLENETAGHIYSYLWLSSDLKGRLESPSFYLEASHTDAQRDVDNLMLTHGWRRFNWEDVMSSKISTPFIPEYRGHIIQGNLYNAEGKPTPGILTYLSSPEKNKWLYTSQSTSGGKLLFDVKHFFGVRQLILQPYLSGDTTQKFVLKNPFSTQYSNFPLPTFWVNPSMERILIRRSLAMQVQDIYYEQENIKTMVTPSDGITFYGKADETYLLDDYTRFPVMEEVMREYVPGVFVRNRKDGFHFLVRDQLNGGLMQEDPLVLLDGVPIFDINKIMSYDPRHVKKLEVVERPYHTGPLLFPGIVSYSTYEGDLSGFELDPKSISINYEGLQLEREFYMPKYENQKQRATRLPDQRFLLYWNPTVNTDKNGTCEIEFFTSDIPGKYRVVVEGIRADGSVGNAIHTFSVRRLVP